MNPAPLLALTFLFRFFQKNRSKPAPARGNWEEPAEWTVVRDDLLLRHLPVIAVVAFLAVFVWPLALLLPLIAFPGSTRRALLSWGFVRPALWLSSLDWWSWRRESARACQCAILAEAVLRKPSDAALLARLDRELERVARITPAVVLAAGIRALAVGDRAEGRRLLRLVGEFDASARSQAARRLATDLLLASAAASGDLESLQIELEQPRSAPTPLARLLGRCLDRVRGKPVSEAQLRAAWFLAGASAETWERVERVLAAPSTAPTPAPTPVAEDPLDNALLATARLMGEAPPPLGAITDAASRWERALSLPEAIPGGAAGAVKLRTEVVELLSERLGSCRERVTGPPDTSVMLEVLWHCGDERDAELSWLSDEIGTRTDQRRALPLLAEVRAWCALVDAYQRVIDVSPQRASSSFAKLYYPSVRHTVWLHNERNQSTLANAMYRVELRFAELVRHDSGVPLLQKNLRCGP